MDVVVVVIAVVLTGALAWYFFGPRATSRAVVRDGVHEVAVTVKGGYSPDVIEVEQGTSTSCLPTSGVRVRLKDEHAARDTEGRPGVVRAHTGSGSRRRAAAARGP